MSTTRFFEAFGDSIPPTVMASCWRAKGAELIQLTSAEDCCARYRNRRRRERGNPTPVGWIYLRSAPIVGML